jgi:hypothetical protein
MNYTQKNSINTNLSHKNINIDLKSNSNACSYSVNESEKASPLGNREIGKRYENIYKKYTRKHIAQYALTVENIKEIRLEKNEKKTRLSKHEFNTRLRFKKSLETINKSLCSCGRDLHFMNTKKTVDVKETVNSRRLKGLKSCGNNSACPVCASKLSTIRGNQLTELMKGGRDNGRSYMMVVTTIPHKPLEPLYRTLNQVIHMSRYIFNSREYKEFKKKSFCRFVHGGLENMVSFKNGQVDWHPHKNYLLDFDISISEVIKNLGLKTEQELRMYVSQMMTRIGQKYLVKENIDKTLLFPYFQQGDNSSRVYVKGGVTASLEFDDGYIAKWGLEAEMTSGIYKDGRITGSMHPFGLLDLINEENEEVTQGQKYQAVKAFQEFVVASKGKWWFYFGVGAIEYYNEYYKMKLKVKKDEEELATLEDEGDLIYFMDEQEWLDFRPNPKKIGYVLSLPTREEVIKFFMEEIEFNRFHLNRKKE